MSAENRLIRPETIAYSHLLIRIPILGVGLYRLVLQDANAQQSFLTLSRENPAIYQGRMARMLQANSKKGFIQWSAAEVGDTFEENADRLEEFNNSFSDSTTD